MRFAAAQLRVEQGEVEANLDRAVALIRRAAGQGADVVVLPEFFTSGVFIGDDMLAVPGRNRDSGALDRLKAESVATSVAVAGSFLEIEGGDVYNAMVLVDPSGAVFRHRKDLPTQFENAYYAPGDAARTCGPFGLAMCWELLRNKTLSELGPDVLVALAGSCWWSLPVGTENLELDAYNDRLCRSTPAAFAALAGLPVVHASLVGRVTTRRGLSRGETVERRLVGATMIVGRDGRILARAAGEDSDDLAIADLELGPRAHRPAQAGFWIPPMRDEYLRAWETENRIGADRYILNRARMVGR
ncbi:MAG: carbon-nitrogen hydrolase family protein [Spirochaetes bacterium]|nr:carbon-nitrogen hydrolase family protein [Spirochaetota bacterium]MBU1079038.1 carbon-nitrogen hydrolase family protein [Spirochaetota bacterium]